ncbi:MAG: hypothetical protein OEY64_08685 [Nitrospinota bacterium]|nr:hypothetical protein [Nitrospinota bacterium]
MKLEKDDILYEELKLVLEKLGVTVELRNLVDDELSIHSGYCELKSGRKLILDKRFSAHERVSVIMQFLKTRNLDNIFIHPAIRARLENIEKNV